MPNTVTLGALAIFAAVTVAIVAQLARMMSHARNQAALPSVRWQARVAAKRQHTSSLGDTVSTWYYVTLESPYGDRHEYAALGTIFGSLTEGDDGEAEIAGDELRSFTRRAQRPE